MGRWEELEEITKPRRPRSRLRRWLVNLTLLAVGGLIGLAVVELILRVVFYFPQPQSLEVDDIVGHRHRPGISGYQVEEGFARYTINSQGFRDREYPVEKPAGTFRIAVLGDSYVEALQVNLEQTFHEILENRLKNTEVLNFGVSGYGTAQELLAYRHYARKFSPDLVLLFFCTGNDLSDNSKRLAAGYPRPYFLLRNGRLELDNSFRQSRRHRLLRRYGHIYYFLTDHSALAEALDRWRRRVTRRSRARRIKKQQAEDQPVEPGLSRGIYGPPTRPDVREAWQLSERLILELASDVEDDGSTLAVVTTTLATQVAADLREKFKREHPGWDIDYPDRRIQEFAAEHGIPCLVLAGAMLDYNIKTGRRLHGFRGADGGHWNAEGHRVVADLLYDFLINRGLIPPEHR